MDLTKGTKYDSEKIRYELIPPEALESWVNIYTIGAKKYAARDWELGISYSRLFGAMMRHAWAYWRGEDYDPETGEHHMACVMFNAAAIITFDKRYPGSSWDDRPTAKRKTS